MRKNKRKQALTLVEMMIVIFIIGIISSVVGVNMKKSMEKGRHFKTKQAIMKLCDIIDIEGENINTSLPQEALKAEVKDVVKKSQFARKGSNLLSDGWGKEFVVKKDDKSGQITFISSKYEDYCKKNGINLDYPWQEENAS